MVTKLLNFLVEKETPKQSEITPSFAETIKQALKGASQEIRVCLPAKIEAYDYKTQKATVKPSIPRKYKDGAVEGLPLIYNVPVAHPRAGKAFIHLPLKKGDNIMLIFADRSIDKWLTNGGEVDPQDTRTHHLSDAIVYPGLYPFNDTAEVTNGDDVIIRNGNTIMHIKANNHLQVINGTTEFVKTICDLMRAIREAVTYTCGGPEKLYHIKFKEIEKRLKSFLEV